LDKQKKFRLTDEIKFELANLVKIIADSPGLFTVDLQELSSGLVVCFVDSSEDTYSAVLVVVRDKPYLGFTIRWTGVDTLTNWN
jgi:hypothetical protein